MRFKPIPVAKHKIKYRNNDLKSLELAYNSVKLENLSVNRAAVNYGIPITTLKDRVAGRVSVTTSASGPESLLSKQEESDLVEHVKYMASVGYGYSRKDLRHVATDLAVYLKKRSPSTELLSDHWVTNFLKRWPSLKLCKPRALEWVRAKSANRTVIDNYYTELENVLRENNLLDKPHLIYNIDETGISTEHAPTRVIARMGSKTQAVVSPRAGTTTIISCGNAGGTAIPPFFVFKGKKLSEDLLQGKSPGATAVMSDSGWSNSVIFRDYLQEHFLTYAQRPRNEDQKLLILYDGHKSHVCNPGIEWARENNIILFVLPPHCSHILQPLDIGCFSPLKAKFNQECQLFMRQNPGRAITRYDICELACRAYAKGLSNTNLIAAFKKAGILPLDKSVISDEKLAPSTIAVEPKSVNDETTGDATVSDLTSTSSVFLTEKQLKRPHGKQRNQNQAKQIITYGGKDITNDKFYEQVKEKENDTAKQKKSVSTKRGKSVGEKVKTGASYSKTAKKSKQEAENKIPNKTQPNCPPPSKEPLPGPSAYHISDSSDSDNEDEVSDSEKCCACKKWQPDDFRNIFHVEFVKWAQCSNCGHWTHLKYCTSVTVLRRNDTFLCPCCQ